jgi:hypothetical protein
MKLSRAEADDKIFQGVKAHAPMNAITYDPLRRSMYYPVLESLLSGLYQYNITYRWKHGIQIIRG